MCNKIGRLYQGWKTCGNRKNRVHLPQGKTEGQKGNLMRAVCDIRPQKTETHRKRLTEDGNIIDYPGDVSTPTSDLTTMKIHVNSAISDVKARCIGKYMKYFYRNGKMMDKAEYIMI